MKAHEISGGVTAAQGFMACGNAAKIKYDRPDRGLLFSEVPAVSVAMFTKNKVQAAPVKLDKLHIADGNVQAVLINSGNANACTGEQGMVDASRMAEVTAEKLGIATESVLVCSTGVIGVTLPMDRVEAGIPVAVQALVADGGDAAAKAIMTTDRTDKQLAVEIEVAGTRVVVGGMAKGAGMIEPNMATMLAFLTTDAAVEREALQSCLEQATNKSFNRISVDGDQSTNDTVILMANGKAGNDELNESHPDWVLFCEAVQHVTLALAKKMVEDGEGATKFVTVAVQGAESDEAAYLAARAIANSLLAKTSWFGEDPNWGRIIAAVGYSGAEFDEQDVEILFDDVWAYAAGKVADEVQLMLLEQVLKQRAFRITVDLHCGSGRDMIYTCDCSHEYVEINSAYTT